MFGLSKIPFTIPIGEQEYEFKLPNDMSPVGIVFTTAPSATAFDVQISVNDTYYPVNLQDGTGTYQIPGGVAGYLPLDLQVIVGLGWFKIVGDVVEAAALNGFLVTRRIS